MRERLFVVACVVAVACGRSPVAPAPVAGVAPGGSATLTVTTTLGNINGPRLSDVTIELDGDAVAVTDANGSASFNVPTDREVEIRVHHPTYRPFVPAVAATFQPRSHETWSFAFVTEPSE